MSSRFATNATRAAMVSILLAAGPLLHSIKSGPIEMVEYSFATDDMSTVT